MKKSDLKNGAVVELRNGEKCFVYEGKLKGIFKFFTYHLKDYNEDLTAMRIETLDIVKVDNTNHLNTNWDYIRKEENLLTDQERNYLKAVIAPVKAEVKYIIKLDFQYEEEYIRIRLSNGFISLYFFKAETQYIGMELYKEYTLEDLGLD